MKHVRTILTLFVALAMALALSLPAFAASGTNDNSGSITINNAVPGQTYNIYQVLVLESYDTDKKAYAYKANPDWEGWLEDQTIYVSIDEQGYVTWVKDADVVAFAKAALAHAKANNIAATQTKTATSETVTFSDLSLGYYLVESSLGTLCSLDTTNPSVIMEEKNEPPTVEKEVQENSTGNWGDENTAQIGDTVNFKTTITIKPGAQDYVLHDEMSEGLTLDPDSIALTLDGTPLNQDYYNVLTANLDDGCDFHITFTQSYLDTITKETVVVVTYSAILNEKAVISNDANTNKTKLDYSENNKTAWDETKTYTFSFDIVKTDEDNKILDGAKFRLYDSKTDGNEIPVVKISDGVYRLAKAGETGVEMETFNGQIEVRGLDANTTYWLQETKAPDGYNKLPDRVEVKIEESNLNATVGNGAWANGGVHVVNKTGSLLPSTGGMGTTLFYIGGGALVVLAIVLLVIKKRRTGGEE